MTEKQENRSSTSKNSKYRETMNLESASGWKKWNLGVFNVTFYPEEYTDLRTELSQDFSLPQDACFDERELVNEMTNNRFQESYKGK